MEKEMLKKIMEVMTCEDVTMADRDKAFLDVVKFTMGKNIEKLEHLSLTFHTENDFEIRENLVQVIETLKRVLVFIETTSTPFVGNSSRECHLNLLSILNMLVSVTVNSPYALGRVMEAVGNIMFENDKPEFMKQKLNNTDITNSDTINGLGEEIIREEERKNIHAV